MRVRPRTVDSPVSPLFLLSLVFFLSAVSAFVTLPPDEVPLECIQICAPIVELSQSCRQKHPDPPAKVRRDMCPGLGMEGPGKESPGSDSPESNSPGSDHSESNHPGKENPLTPSTVVARHHRGVRSVGDHNYHPRDFLVVISRPPGILSTFTLKESRKPSTLSTPPKTACTTADLVQDTDIGVANIDDDDDDNENGSSIADIDRITGIPLTFLTMETSTMMFEEPPSPIFSTLPDETSPAPQDASTDAVLPETVNLDSTTMTPSTIITSDDDNTRVSATQDATTSQTDASEAEATQTPTSPATGTRPTTESRPTTTQPPPPLTQTQTTTQQASSESPITQPPPPDSQATPSPSTTQSSAATTLSTLTSESPTPLPANPNSPEEQCFCNNKSFDVARIAALCNSCIGQTGLANSPVVQMAQSCQFPLTAVYSNRDDRIVNGVVVRVPDTLDTDAGKQDGSGGFWMTATVASGPVLTDATDIAPSLAVVPVSCCYLLFLLLVL